MVMRKNRMRKNLLKTIWNSMGRYLAIVAIIGLGCAIFVGLRVTKTDMIATGQKYTDEQNMFDLRLLNTYGWNKGDVEKIAAMEGVTEAEGTVTLDVYARQGSEAEDQVYRLYSIPESINQVYLLSGRMPESPDECLVDGDHATDAVLGTQVVISGTNDEDTLDSLNYHTYTVVGYISTPLYMDMTRGSTSLGSGSLTSYIYIPEAAFDVDYYTEINVTIPGDWVIYSEEYNDAMDAMAETLESAIMPIARERGEQVKEEAQKLYAEGLQEYEDGLAEYEKAKTEALQELADALRELTDARSEIDSNMQTVLDGEKQLADGEKQLQENARLLAQSRVELENAKADTYAQLADANQELIDNEKAAREGLQQIEDGMAQIDAALPQIEDGIAQIDEALPQLELAISLADIQIQTTKSALEAAKLTGSETLIASLEAQLSEQQAQREEYAAQRQEVVATRAQLVKQQEELTAQRAELETTKVTVQEGLTAIENGYKELETGKLQAESEFASAEAQLQSGELQLEEAQRELNSKKQELADGRAKLEEAQAELDEGWAEYESGKAEAEKELADAEQELADAEAELADAKKTIDEMGEPDVYALTRNTNAGYLALDSNSDIVSGIALVLPVFFVLIAALVCITTMTRMVEEERTQIGTLKALGYSGYRIMNKYLIYSASAAVIGCGLGVLVGSVFFPKLLWNAYGILFNITPGVELVFDWQLSLGITVLYLAASSLVTWYSCHRTLREVPAELIRPKAPAAGKKILLERLPFWHKLSFLNKVMLRNVVRYRQRMLMMLVGIGGCTALLLTGFGLRDTIMDVANIQFEEVSLFDIEVYFSEGQTEAQQEEFRETLGDTAEAVGFFYQTSVELEYDGKARDVYLIGADDAIGNFMSFHSGEKQLTMPGTGEAYLSVGVAENLGVRLGDTVTLRNSDLESMTLQVTGIYDNHVYNYIVVTPETITQQWGEMPLNQMAFVNVPDGADIHEASSVISGMENVASISACEDVAEMFNSMMDALELVVVVIVFCAGLLAAIVLYNLTNININERIRETATIKVLGFNAKETSAYVFKENILLTVLGAGGGLILGKYFLDFVMSRIKIDMVWFQTRLSVPSYLYAVALTLLCAAVVDYIFHRKLDQINMAEALKSVE